MKRKTRKIAIGVLTGCIAATGVTALAACGKTVAFPPFNYDYIKTEDFGDGILLDGKLDEAQWQGQRVLDADIRNTSCVFRMTSYYGEKGVYFGFDITDDAVYFNEGTLTEINSGVQFCIGPKVSASNSVVTDCTYRISLNAGGVSLLRKWVSPATNSNDGFADWSKDLHSKVWMNGEINGECEGYSVELYLPYSMFHEQDDADKDAKPEQLYVSPALVRASSPYATSDWSQRLWYGIGIEERGIGWNYPAANWYQFNEEGLVAEDVTITSGEHGSVEGKSWYIAGDSYVMTVKPDAGYCVSSLKVNGKEVKDEIYYRSGVALCAVKESAALNIEAQFEALPEQKHTLGGTVSVSGGAALPALTLYAGRAGAYAPIEVAADGSYSVELARGEWTLFTEANGYLTTAQTINIVADTTKNIVLSRSFMQADNAAEWDFTDLGMGTVVGLSGGWMVHSRHTEIESTEVFVSGRLVVPMVAGSDTRIGFTFWSGSKKVYVCLLANGENGANSYGVQIIASGGSNDEWGNGDVSDLESTVGKEIRALASGDGVPFAAQWKEGKLSVWVNGTCVRDAVALDGKYGLTETTKVVPGLTTCGKGAYYDLDFALEGRGAVNGTLKDKDGKALSNVTVTLTPEGGAELTQTTNASGAFDFGKVEVGSYTLTIAESGYNKYEGDFLVTSAGVIKDITLSEFTAGADQIASGGENFDYSQIAEGKIVYTYGGEVHDTMSHELVFKQKAKANEDFYATAVIKKQDTFVMNNAGGIRYGFVFRDGGGSELVATFTYDRAHNNWLMQFTDWNSLWSGKDIGAEAPAAWTDGTGYRIGVARINGAFHFYLEDENGVMQQVATEKGSPLNNKEVTMSVACWTQVKNAEFTEFGWTTGRVPVDVVKNTPDNGTVAVSASPVIGGNITVTLTPASGYLPESLTINGENKAGGLQKDGDNYVLTLSAFTAKTLKINAAFIEQAEVDVTLVFTGLADGTAVAIKGAGGNKTANVTANKAAFEGVAKGSYTVSVEGYQDQTVEITAAGEINVTLKLIDYNALMQEKYVESQGECYDLGKIEREKKIVYTGTSGESHMKFKAAASEAENFWIESTFKVQSSFLQGEGGGFRYGFTIFGGTDTHFTVLDNTGFAINNWSDIDMRCDMNSAQKALINGAGLRVAVARIGGRVYLLADDGNGNMISMLSTTGGQLTARTVNLGLATWYQAKDLEYNNFAFETGGNINVAVTKNAPEHGTLEVTENPVLGGSATITLAPASGYVVSSLSVNGENKTANLTENEGVYTLTLNNLLSKELKVNAAFIEKAEVNVTLKFTGIADGTKVTLESLNNTYQVTVNNGEATLTGAAKGTYTASATNCHSAEVTLSEDGEVAVGLTAFTKNEIMAAKYVESGAENYDVSGYEDNKIVFTGTKESYMTLKKRAPANEDMMILTRIKAQNTFANDVSFGYVLTGTSSGQQLICRFTHDVANSNWLIQLTNWSYWGGHNLTAEQLALYNGVSGLYFGIARVDGKWLIYIEQNGAMQLVHTSDFSNIANEELKIELVAWGSASGAEYNDFEILTGDISVTVNKAAAEHGTIEVTENPVLGGNVTVTLTPETGYTLSQVTINGTVTTATQSGDAYVVTLNNYLASRTLAVAATFVEKTEFDVTLLVAGVPDDTEITLKGLNTYQGTAVNGSVTLSKVQKGDYTVEAEYYHSDDITVSAEGDITVNLVAFTAQEKMTAIYVDYGSENFDVSKIESEKKVTFTGTDTSQMKLKASATASQDFWMESTVKFQDSFETVESGALPSGGYRLGFALFPQDRATAYCTVARYMYNAGDDKNPDMRDSGWVFKFDNWADMNTNTPLTQAQITAFTSTGLRIATARIDNWLYIFADDGEGNMTMVYRGSFPTVAGKVVNLGFATWPQAKGLEYNDVAWSIGSVPEGITVPEISENERMFLSGTENWDVSALATEKKVSTSTGGELAFNFKADDGENIYVEALLKRNTMSYTITEKEDGSVVINEGGLRYGFVFADSAFMCFHLTANAGEALVFQVINWDGWYPSGAFTADEVKAWVSGDGVRVGAGRFNNKWMAFIERDVDGKKVMVKVFERDADGRATVLKLAGAAGATYEDLLWQVGNGIDMTRLKVD